MSITYRVYMQREDDSYPVLHWETEVESIAKEVLRECLDGGHSNSFIGIEYK